MVYSSVGNTVEKSDSADLGGIGGAGGETGGRVSESRNDQENFASIFFLRQQFSVFLPWFLQPQFSGILPHYGFCARSFLDFCLIMVFAAAVFWIPAPQISGFLRRSFLES